MHVLEVNDIGLVEDGNPVLQNIRFRQKAFEKIALAGETGSGKSSLLQTIAGFIQPTTGEVLFNGKRVIGPQEQLIPGHPEIAYLSQQFELPQFLRVEQVLAYANNLTDEAAEELFALCRINHLMQRNTNQLSGGERQRIALARLLLGAPRLLLLDEPFSNLDMGHKTILKSVINDIGEQLEITLMLVSHDPLDTLSWADQMLVMQQGRLVQQGPPQQLYHQPNSEYVASLFGAYNLLLPHQLPDLSPQLTGEQSAKKRLIRPENLKLSSQPNKGLTGILKQQTFFGSFYQYTIAVGDILITSQSPDHTFKPGDAVWVTVAPEAIWLL